MRTIPRFPWRARALHLAGLAALVAGCSAPLLRHRGTESNLPPSGKPSWTLVPPSTDASGPQASAPEISFQRQIPTDPEFDENYPRVDEFLEVFRTEKRAFFQHALERSRKYLPRMTRIMEEEGLPQELAYLPLIESGFHTGAVSRAGAVGPWQFIRGTGRRYGLRIDRYVDERRDPVKSTRAAAHYLRDLYEMFGSWHLSLAAYNTGEERIARIKDRNGAETFWEMTERGYLHPETDDYVPQFLAALQIARAPREHGFEEPHTDPFEYDLVKIDRSLPLRQLARLAGVEPREVLELNPALVRGVTPPDRGGYRLRVPKGTKEQFAIAYERLLRDLSSVVARAETVRERAYRVRPGDTPAAVARRFGVSVAALMRANGWTNARRIRPGMQVRVPGPNGSRAELQPNRRQATAARGQGGRPDRYATYRVKKGDTASSIASRFGTTVAELARANGWNSGEAIRAGAAIRVPVATGAEPRSGGNSAAPAKPASSSKRIVLDAWMDTDAPKPAAPRGAAASAALAPVSRPGAPIAYRVQAGDTLSLLSARYGVDIETLADLNGVRDPKSLRPGMLLRIPATPHRSTPVVGTGAAAPARQLAEAARCETVRTYRIRKGDSPASIAKRFGVPVAALMEHNGWRNPRRLRPGQAIEIPGNCESDVRVAYRRSKSPARMN